MNWRKEPKIVQKIDARRKIKINARGIKKFRQK
jgi:hypothetical protein